MFDFTILGRRRRPSTVLCLGAHCDDIEIGCGGSILRILREHPKVRVHWVVFTSGAGRKAEVIRSARRFLRGAAGNRVTVLGFRDSYLPYIGGEVKEAMEGIRKTLSPDLIFTHHRNDLHQDHRLVCELTWNAFRTHPILEYEIPKYDGDLGSPNVLVPLEGDIVRRKVRNILQVYRTQSGKHWLREDLLLALMRLRGMESGSGSRYAEGFYGRKIVLGTSAGRRRA